MTESTTALVAIIGTLLTGLLSAGAWKFYDNRITQIKQSQKEEREESKLYREDLRQRINNLESLLIESAKEKAKMIDTIITLTSQVATLSTKVEYLEKENEILSRIK